jgi:hypothetical protein
MALEFSSRDDQVLATVLVDMGLATPQQVQKLMAEANASGMPLAFAVFSHGTVPDDKRGIVDAAVAELSANPDAKLRAFSEMAVDPGPVARATPRPDVVQDALTARRRTPLPDVPLHTPSKGTPAVSSGYIGAPRSTPAPRSKGKRYVPRRNRDGGASDDVDIGAVKGELGIGGVAAQGELALAETARRVLPTRLHVTCFASVLGFHHGSITAVRLARDAGCTEDEAGRALEHWHAIGLMTRAEKGMARYRVDEAAFGDPAIQTLTSYVEDPGLHGHVLAWIDAPGEDT